MIKCSKCGKELPDGSKFCDGCGSPIAAGIVCSNCHQPVAPGVAFCQTCGTPVGAPAAAPAPKKPAPDVAKVVGNITEKVKALPKPVLLGIAGVAVVLVLVLVISLFGGGNPNFALYEKDGEVVYNALSSKDPYEVTSDYRESAQSSPLVSADGKKIFYTDKESGNLYVKKLGNEKAEAVKLSGSVGKYHVNDKGNQVIYLKEGSLYVHDLKDSEKIASEVGAFYASNDGKTIVYLNREGTLYIKKGNKDAEKITSECGDYEISKDFKYVWYDKDGALYCFDGKESTKVDSDVGDWYVTEDKLAYYTVRTDDGQSLYFYDGKEPVELTDELYYISGVSTEAAVAVYSVRDGEDIEYFAAVGAEINELESEDVISYSIAPNGKALYYTLLEDKDSNDAAIYECKVSGKKVKEGKLIDEEVEALAGITENGDVIYFKEISEKGSGDLYVNGKKVCTDVYTDSVTYSEEENKLMFLTDYSNGCGNLNVCKIGSTKPSKIDSDVYDYEFTPDGDILYLKDRSDSGKSDLYRTTGNKEGKKIDEDVTYLYGIRIVTEDRHYGYARN